MTEHCPNPSCGRPIPADQALPWWTQNDVSTPSQDDRAVVHPSLPGESGDDAIGWNREGLTGRERVDSPRLVDEHPSRPLLGGSVVPLVVTVAARESGLLVHRANVPCDRALTAMPPEGRLS